MQKRIVTIDFIRGFAIIFIVLVHVLQRCVPNFNYNFLISFFIVLSVPLYMFVSGLAYSYKNYITIKQLPYQILKKTFNYFWPFLLFLILKTYMIGRWANLSEAFGDVIPSTSYGLWILWILLFISIITEIGLCLAKFAPQYKSYFVVSLLVVGMIILYYLRINHIIVYLDAIAYDYFMLYTPIFIIGFVFGQKMLQIKMKKSIAFILFPITILILFLLTMSFPYFGVYDFIYYWPKLYVLMSFSFIFYLCLISILKDSKVYYLFAKQGKISLEIYFVHLVFLGFFSFIEFSNVYLTILSAIGLYLACFALSFVIVFISYYIPFLHFLMFGRSYSFYKFETKFFIRLKAILTFRK